MEGVTLRIPEGLEQTNLAVHTIAFVALPDGRTVVGIQFAHMGGVAGYVSEIRGLGFCFANDLFNRFTRTLSGSFGDCVPQAPAGEASTERIPGSWANVDDCVGVLRLYGRDDGGLSLHRSAGRVGELYPSLDVETICSDALDGAVRREAGPVLLDTGWAVLSGTHSGSTQAASQEITAIHPPNAGGAASRKREVWAVGADGHTYVVSFAPEDCRLLVVKDNDVLAAMSFAPVA